MYRDLKITKFIWIFSLEKQSFKKVTNALQKDKKRKGKEAAHFIDGSYIVLDLLRKR